MKPQRETVVLVHGLWLHGFVFAAMRTWLRRRGYAVRCFSYASVRCGLADNARALAAFVAAIEARRIHLVGHSLGGLLVLAMLAAHADARLGRVVLLGAPCAGSYSAEWLLRQRGLAKIVGRSLVDWLRQPLPTLPAGVAIGVVAGSRRLGLGCIIRGLPLPNDGGVAVTETRLAAARDTITLPLGHSQMLVSRACAEQVAAFLASGSFVHA